MISDGSLETNTAAAQSCASSMLTAYNAAVAQTCTSTISDELSGQTLGAGVYCSASGFFTLSSTCLALQRM